MGMRGRNGGKLLGLLMLLACAQPALAYIGPGAGLSLIGSLFGWIVGIFLTLFAIVLWPLRYLLRRLFRRRRPTKGAAAAPEAHSETAQAAPAREESAP